MIVDTDIGPVTVQGPVYLEATLITTPEVDLPVQSVIINGQVIEGYIYSSLLPTPNVVTMASSNIAYCLNENTRRVAWLLSGLADMGGDDPISGVLDLNGFSFQNLAEYDSEPSTILVNRGLTLTVDSVLFTVDNTTITSDTK